MKNIMLITLLFVLSTIFVGCGTREVAVPGYQMVSKKGAYYRTEGGGIDSTYYHVGKRHNIGRRAEAIHVRYTPQVITVTKKS